eukprot:352331-Chlamydomonas_euryale.AAC.9
MRKTGGGLRNRRYHHQRGTACLRNPRNHHPRGTACQANHTRSGIILFLPPISPPLLACFHVPVSTPCRYRGRSQGPHSNV